MRKDGAIAVAVATSAAPAPSPSLPSLGVRALGLTGLAVALVSIYWIGEGRLEVAAACDWTARLSYLAERLSSDRVTYAFAVDCLLYTVFQAYLMNKQGAPFWFVPFWGQAVWLLMDLRKGEGKKDQ